MTVDKTQSATQPVFQPRLRPRPALPERFSQELAGRLDGQPGSGDVAVRIAPGTPGTEVRGTVERPGEGRAGRESTHAVRGTVVWPSRPGETADAGLSAPSAAQGSPAATVQSAGPSAAAPAAQGPAPSSAHSPAPPAAQSPAAPPRSFSAADEAALLAWAEAVKTPPPRRTGSGRRATARATGPGSLPLPADPVVLAVTAQAQAGKPYVDGGESPRRGFDCSGLTSYVYGRSGIELPRNSREQFRHGFKVRREDLQKGDLVFFGKKGVHHVGIYMGGGEFLHAASAGGKVKVDSLDDPHWSGSFTGARRIVGSDAGMSPDMASSRAV